MRFGLLFFALAGLLASGATRATAQEGDAARLVGNWRLVSYYNFPADGPPQRARFDAGRIMYDAAGHMAAQLMVSGDDRANPTTPEARAAAYGRYLAYYGPFKVDEAKKVVTHHVEGSSYPHWVGSAQVRHYELAPDGNRLMLSVKNGDRISGTLTWERVR